MGSGRPFSEETATLIDAEVRRILDECYAEAVDLLSQHRKELDKLTNALLEHETLDEQQILQVTGLPPAPKLESDPLPLLPIEPRDDAGDGATRPRVAPSHH
jgi:cell division protease FtsH